MGVLDYASDTRAQKIGMKRLNSSKSEFCRVFLTHGSLAGHANQGFEDEEEG